MENFKIKLFCRFLSICFLLGMIVNFSKAEKTTVCEIINKLNVEYNIELNIFVNTAESEEILKMIEQSKLIFNESLKNITATTKYATGNCLTIINMNINNMQTLLNITEKFLWGIHFTNILIIWQGNVSVEIDDDQELSELFQECWKKGHSNVIVWSNGDLLTYSPYPKIETIKLHDFRTYRQKMHLYNFQKHAWYMPFVQLPPRCYSFTDHLGNLKRTGYLYKTIELFVKHYNGTLEYLDVDMWANSWSRTMINEGLGNSNFDFFPTAYYEVEHLSPSYVLWIQQRKIIVPAPKEIPAKLYFVIPFTGCVWLVNVVVLFVVFLLIYSVNCWKFRYFDKGNTFLQAFGTLLFLSFTKSKSKSCINYFLNLLPLISGLLLVSFYNCNLSSMLTSKIFEAPLRNIRDIAKNDLLIFEYSIDAQFYQDYDLPAIVYDRLYVGNNTLYYQYRKNLDMSTYIFPLAEDVVNFLLLQQRYLKNPIAKLLDQPIFSRHLNLAMPDRSPLIDHFNRYLLYLKDSGVIQKLISDSEWDGIRSGEIQFFKDPDTSKSLTLDYFQYAFVIWSSGLAVASLCFLKEILCRKMCF